MDAKASPKSKDVRNLTTTSETIRYSKSRKEIERYLKLNDRLLSQGVQGERALKTSSSFTKQQLKNVASIVQGSEAGDV